MCVCVCVFLGQIVLRLTTGEVKRVVSGISCKIGDLIPYVPVGSRLGKGIVTEVRVQGILSQGVIFDKSVLEVTIC